MTILTATVPTASASRYLQQLCKHWSHKYEVDFDADQGRIVLPFGVTDLAADATVLTVTIALVEGGDAERAKRVVAEHLNRFAFREGELVFDWSED